MRQWIAASLVSLLALTACGAPVPASLRPTAQASGIVESLGIPPAHKFVTVQCIVTKILPDDTQGLPHQLFMVRVTKGTSEGVYEVSNNTHHGSKVTNLKVGDALTIRGTLYTGGDRGIHWTHQANKPFDAGWIKTKDGAVYQ
ncbi:MAG: DUF3465 domain-containing protein [Candidatus Sericytochromatia bacterium]|nr:DUF3465 domain-containing protein [Candidatus Sericytochromatia bacterium]